MEEAKLQELNELLESARLQAEDASRRLDFFDDMPWLKRLLAKFIWSIWWDTSSEDTHCFVTCACGEDLSATDFDITWCTACGAGYSTKFTCYKYPKWLRGGWGDA